MRHDHMANNCTNEEACSVNQEIGHRAGTMKYSVFRKALNKARFPVRCTNDSSGIKHRKEKPEANSESGKR